MTDRELLEFAARAMRARGDTAFLNYEVAGDSIRLELGSRRGAISKSWNPLTDDGDALGLVSSLKLHILWASHADFVLVCNDASEAQTITIQEKLGTDRSGAIRHAIVRAAAEIGKGSI